MATAIVKNSLLAVQGSDGNETMAVGSGGGLEHHEIVLDRNRDVPRVPGAGDLGVPIDPQTQFLESLGEGWRGWLLRLIRSRLVEAQSNQIARTRVTVVRDHEIDQRMGTHHSRCRAYVRGCKAPRALQTRQRKELDGPHSGGWRARRKRRRRRILRKGSKVVSDDLSKARRDQQPVLLADFDGGRTSQGLTAFQPSGVGMEDLNRRPMMRLLDEEEALVEEQKGVLLVPSLAMFDGRSLPGHLRRLLDSRDAAVEAIRRASCNRMILSVALPHFSEDMLHQRSGAFLALFEGDPPLPSVHQALESEGSREHFSTQGLPDFKVFGDLSEGLASGLEVEERPQATELAGDPPPDLERKHGAWVQGH